MSVFYRKPSEPLVIETEACKKCVKEGTGHHIASESRSSISGANSTEYFGKDGNKHVHISGTNIVKWTCSNGHSWQHYFYVRCVACGWSYDAEIAERMAQPDA